MEQIVTNVQKKRFIKWLIEQRVIVNRETIWLLNYLRSNEHLLNIIHFVEVNRGRSRSMTINCGARRDNDFMYMKLSVSTNDPEKAFHDLRLNQEDPLYIKIELAAEQFGAEYFAVIEDDPEVSSSFVHRTYGKAAALAASAAELAYAETILYEQINTALDEGDESRFLELSARWKALHCSPKH
ncbi:MAG: YpiB family protein [Sporolactobacillus sp.]